MTLRSSIFGSKSERNLYYSIRKRWGSKYNIYQQLPFGALFDIDTLSLSSGEKRFLLMTSVDYTVCDRDDRPLISIEFDGMGSGYSHNEEYVQASPCEDSRKWKMDLKLRIAREDRYPFFVVSDKESVRLGPAICLSIVDGVIGQTLAGMETESRWNQILKDTEPVLADMPPDERTECLVDLHTGLWVEMEIEHDPIAQQVFQLARIARRKGIGQTCSMQPLRDPNQPVHEVTMAELILCLQGKPGGKPPTHIPREIPPDDVQMELRYESESTKCGYRVTLSTKSGQVDAEAWVRNVGGSGVYAGTLAMNIAKLLAYRTALYPERMQ